MGGDVIVGIDLGTTNSAVAVADGGHARVLCDADGSRLVPSVVSFPPDGRVLVGDLARERRLVDAENTVHAIKRLIGRPFDSPEVRRASERFAFRLVEGERGSVRVLARGQTYALAEISAFVLRECRRVAEQVLGVPCRKAVVTVPAAFNELQRSATKAAGRVAGLDVVRILNEPTAAALAYGCRERGAERVAVYDLGGGTFDVTILELDGDVFQVVSTQGDTFLGGEDIDLAVAEDMADAFQRRHGVDPRSDRQALERLRAAAEWAKCQLSTDTETRLRVARLLEGRGGEPLDLEYRLTRMRLEEMILPLVNRSLGVCAGALREAGLRPSDIDTVLLVGGSTRIPLVRQLVRDFFGREPRTDIDPDLVVALGAAIHGHALSGAPSGRSYSDLPPPSPELVARTQRRKAEARAARPEQPAFAPEQPPAAPPPALRPPLPLPPPAPLMPLPHRAIRGPSTVGVMPLVRVGVPASPSTTLKTDRAAPHPAASEGRRTADAETTTSDLVAEEVDASELESIHPPPLPLPPPGDPSRDDSLLERPRHGEPDLGIDEPFAIPRAPRPPRAVTRRDATSDAAGLDLDAPDPSIDSVSEVRADPDEIPLPAYPSQLPPPPVPALAIPVIAMDGGPPPVLMDVAPHSLGVMTAGGYCERIVKRNSPVPIEQIRMFTTARDGQQEVEIRICQGESRRYEENQHLGVIELSGLRAAPRGQVRIAVVFVVDADGTLEVTARDEEGHERAVRLRLLGDIDPQTLEQMRERQERSES